MNSLINWLPLKGAELDPGTLLLIMSNNRIVQGVVQRNSPNTITLLGNFVLDTNDLPEYNYYYCYQSDIEHFTIQ